MIDAYEYLIQILDQWKLTVSELSLLTGQSTKDIDNILENKSHLITNWGATETDRRIMQLINLDTYLTVLTQSEALPPNAKNQWLRHTNARLQIVPLTWMKQHPKNIISINSYLQNILEEKGL